jgi:nitrite reductase/ring-hydroxylating ferredoxin subunit
MTWPIALERDIHPYGLVRASLDGRDLLVWRDDCDQIRVWEDRCPHRSIRLSAGRNLGDCIQSAYHGWRFGKNGAVLAIPAELHAPRPDIKVRSISSQIAFGMVWATLEGEPLLPAEFAPDKDEVLLRPLPINAPPNALQPFLSSLPAIRFIATPTGKASCKLFGCAKACAEDTRLQTARRANHQLNALRRSVEANAAA